LEDILEAIQMIEKYSSLGKEKFHENELIQSWCRSQLQVIGEATRHLQAQRPDWLRAHPEISWDDIVAMRNRLVHGYFEIQLGTVWDTIERDLPNLKKAATALLQLST
jgi:uncharacterized protein with HEPN domain